MQKQKPSERIKEELLKMQLMDKGENEMISRVFDLIIEFLDEQQSEIDTLKAQVKTLESTSINNH